MFKRNTKIILLFIIITVFFYWKLFFQDKVLFPGDLLVGAYFPWLESKWGYAVGVPVKNPLISDIFSQFHPWKSLIAESLAKGQWPLWNPYMYSGYPLLANFNSGALNPFNLLMVLFGDVRGWNYLIVSQTLGSLIAFYLYMRAMKLSRDASIVGAVVYSFSGFAITWLPFVNVGFAFIWIALIFFSIEKKRFLFIAPLLFLLTTAGHFQAVVFGCILFGLYFIYRATSKKEYFLFGLSVVLGLLMSSVQLFPTFEFMNQSIRFHEGYIANYSFGLLPIQNILTFLVPDFFGNAATGNYWGPFNYHESVIYVGIFAVMAFIGTIYRFKELKLFKFFFFSVVISTVLIFDTFIGRSIYEYKVPLISTSAAGRISMIIVFSASCLSAWWFDRLKKLTFREVVRIYWWWMLGYGVIFTISFYSYKLFTPYIDLNPEGMLRAKIAWRNVVTPTAISVMLLFAFLFMRKVKGFFVIILLIIMLDSFRFGWKYLPFVNSEFIYPKTEATEFLKNQKGVFRVDREHAQVLPPNTWVSYRLQSPSGYDPMAIESYVDKYQKFLNSDDSGNISRYSELSIYDARKLGEWNVKYLMAIRRDEHNEIVDNATDYFYLINKPDWKKVFESENTLVLENNYYQERARLINTQGTVEITKYSPEEVIINYSAENNGELILMDTNYPGWKAYVKGERREISNHEDVFRKVNIGKGEGTVVFTYKPESFYWGLRISLVALLIWLITYKYNAT